MTENSDKLLYQDYFLKVGNKMRNEKKQAFTLIELIIVVAIIAILAAIAIPNFLEAQTRAKVARVQSDMRTIGMALETYRVDTNLYVFPSYGHSTNGGIDSTFDLSNPAQDILSQTDNRTYKKSDMPMSFLTNRTSKTLNKIA